MKEKRGSSFIESTFVLMVASIVVKLIGAFYSIPLTNLYGAAGTGCGAEAMQAQGAAMCGGACCVSRAPMLRRPLDGAECSMWLPQSSGAPVV